MSPNNADGMAYSVDPDQTAPPLGAVWSRSGLFAQTCLPKNLGKLRNGKNFQSEPQGRLISHYRKNPKYLDTPKICCNHPKIWIR